MQDRNLAHQRCACLPLPGSKPTVDISLHFRAQMIETSVLFRRLAQFFHSGAVPFEKVRNMLLSEQFLFRERSRFLSYLAVVFFVNGHKQVIHFAVCLRWRNLTLNGRITKDKNLTVSVRCQSLYSFVSGYQMLQTSNMTWRSLIFGAED